MASLLDTSVAIYLRDADPDIVGRTMALPQRPLLSLPTLVELEGGASGTSEAAVRRRARLEVLTRRFEVLAFDREVVRLYGSIVAALGFNRRMIVDRLIAATALRFDLDLITTNSRDFVAIPGLRVIDWG